MKVGFKAWCYSRGPGDDWQPPGGHSSGLGPALHPEPQVQKYLEVNYTGILFGMSTLARRELVTGKAT